MGPLALYARVKGHFFGEEASGGGIYWAGGGGFDDLAGTEPSEEMLGWVWGEGGAAEGID